MNNKYRRGVSAIAIQLTVASIGLYTPTLANPEKNLYQFCSKFPHNSRCVGQDISVPFNQREGEKAKCLLQGEEKASTCKLLLSQDALTAYIKLKKTDKNNESIKDTTEVVIPLSNVENIQYSEKSKVNIGAVVAFGLPGLFAKIKRSTFNIRYISTSDSSDSSDTSDNSDSSDTSDNIETVKPISELDTSQSESSGSEPDDIGNTDESPKVTVPQDSAPKLETQTSQQLLFVIRRGRGRELRTELESLTGLTAETLSIN